MISVHSTGSSPERFIFDYAWPGQALGDVEAALVVCKGGSTMLKMDPDLSGSVLAEVAKAKRLRRRKNPPNSSPASRGRHQGAVHTIACNGAGYRIQDTGCGGARCKL
jgi:hypothetical protein